jgi:hypothetical protein
MKSRFLHSSQFRSNDPNKRRALGLRVPDTSGAIDANSAVRSAEVRVELSSLVREAQ